MFEDPDFKEFLEELKNPKPSELPTIDSTLADIDKREKELKGEPKTFFQLILLYNRKRKRVFIRF